MVWDGHLLISIQTNTETMTKSSEKVVKVKPVKKNDNSRAVTPVSEARAVSTVQGRMLTREEIARFGNAALQRVESITMEVTEKAKLSELDEMGKMVQSLLEETSKFDPSYKAKIMGLIPRPVRQMVRRHDKVDASVESLTRSLDQRIDHYRDQIGQLHELYESNIAYYDELVRDIEELKASIEFMRENPPEVDVEDPFSAQLLQRHEQTIFLAEKRLDGLQRSAQLARQAAPQIEIMAVNAMNLSGTFDDLKYNAIPTMRRTFTMYLVNRDQAKGAEISSMVRNAAQRSLEANGKQLNETTRLIHAETAIPTYSLDAIERNRTVVQEALITMDKARKEARANLLKDAPRLENMTKDMALALIPSEHATKLLEAK